jgi:hypothetical protein
MSEEKMNKLMENASINIYTNEKFEIIVDKKYMFFLSLNNNTILDNKFTIAIILINETYNLNTEKHNKKEEFRWILCTDTMNKIKNVSNDNIQPFMKCLEVDPKFKCIIQEDFILIEILAIEESIRLIQEDIDINNPEPDRKKKLEEKIILKQQEIQKLNQEQQPDITDNQVKPLEIQGQQPLEIQGQQPQQPSILNRGKGWIQENPEMSTGLGLLAASGLTIGSIVAAGLLGGRKTKRKKVFKRRSNKRKKVFKRRSKKRKKHF